MASMRQQAFLWAQSVQCERALRSKVSDLTCGGCRPHHEELHGWANQLLLSKSVLLEALQQQVEKQAAMTELIRKIREPDTPAASAPAAARMHPPPMLEPPSPSASLSIDRDFAHTKVPSKSHEFSPSMSGTCEGRMIPESRARR